MIQLFLWNNISIMKIKSLNINGELFIQDAHLLFTVPTSYLVCVYVCVSIYIPKDASKMAYHFKWSYLPITPVEIQ